MEEEALGEYDTRLPRKLVGPNFTVFYGKKITKEEIAPEKEKEKKRKKAREKKRKKEDAKTDVAVEASSMNCLERTKWIRNCGNSPPWFRNSG
jgi:hypothetical protein